MKNEMSSEFLDNISNEFNDVLDDTKVWADEKIKLMRMQEALKLRIKANDEAARELGVPIKSLNIALSNKLNEWSLTEDEKQNIQKCEDFWSEYSKINVEVYEFIK